MNAILMSNMGGSIMVGEKRVPTQLWIKNGQLDKIKTFWKDNAKVMLISAAPDNFERNDGMMSIFKYSFPMSRLSVSLFTLCDSRTEDVIERLGEMDVIILAGGHVPTQNAFFKKLQLKERLSEYKGLVLAWSAGAMNCAELVYAGPELEGEAIDPNYQRWITGLGLTKVNIFPHFQKLQGEMLDGLRLIEDITYTDSMGHEFIALNDGSYIVVAGGTTTLYGEAYSIKDGCQKQICRDDESIVLG